EAVVMPPVPAEPPDAVTGGPSVPASRCCFAESSLQAAAKAIESNASAEARGPKAAARLFMVREARSLARLYICESIPTLLRARAVISRRAGTDRARL